MTDPKQSDNGWNLQDLPVLTEVVAESAGELEVPAFDFSAELDELARSMPAPAEPELELPPELSLDDVLGDEPQPDDDAASLDASKLIERLPSLDLEVDEPGDLSLDDVLPGLAPVADVESSPVTDADFAFELPGEPQSVEVAPAAEAGLDALFARARGWVPSGQFTLGKWGTLVNIGALLYGVGAIVNMAWPRSPASPWYINYAMVLTTLVVIGFGLVYMWLRKPYDRGNAPAGDAWKVSGRASAKAGAAEAA